MNNFKVNIKKMTNRKIKIPNFGKGDLYNQKRGDF